MLPKLKLQAVATAFNLHSISLRTMIQGVLRPSILVLTLCLMTFFWQKSIAEPVVRLSTGDMPEVTASDDYARIARWKDDKTAVFLLMFDDGWPSQWSVAAPELIKRNMIATFYINPEKGEYKKFAQQWEQKLWKQGMVYGDHTMTHQGVKDMANAEWEIGECANIIRRIVGASATSLVSYGQPGLGAGAWNITPQQTNELLQKYHLINRPTFDGHGAVYHLQTTQQMLDLADMAIQAKGMEYLVIHGIERVKDDWGYQDFWALKQSVFLPLLDGLAERRDKNNLWITDHISYHKYATERDNAKLQVVKASGKAIELSLTAKVDAQLYDAPLTIITRVPAGWKRVNIRQAGQATTAVASKGQLMFDAVPGPNNISLSQQ